MQEYNELVTTDACNTYLEKADKNIQSVASTFSGTAFPTTNLKVGMQCMRTDDSNNIYKLTSVSPVKWELVPSKSYVDNAVSTGVKSVVNFKGATSTAAGTAGLVPAPAKDTQTDYYLSADGTWKKVQQRTIKEVIDIVHPVGSIWETTTTDDPNVLWSGTTWVKMDAGRVLVSAGTYAENGTTYTYNLGDKGGEAKHQITVDELACHGHDSILDDRLATDDETRPNADAWYQATHWTNHYRRIDNNVMYKGASKPHNNLQPAKAVFVWFRVS